VRGQRIELVKYFRQHRIGLVQNLKVRKSQNSHAGGFQRPGPLCVVSRLRSIDVMSTVNLNCQRALVTIKVEYVWTERVLTPELDAGSMSVSRATPQDRFGICNGASEGSSDAR
jgi:hypothetical protein